MLKRHGGSPIAFATPLPFTSEGHRLSAMAPRAHVRLRRLTIAVVVITTTGVARRVTDVGTSFTTRMAVANRGRLAVKGASTASPTAEDGALPEISENVPRNVNYNGIA